MKTGMRSFRTVTPNQQPPRTRATGQWKIPHDLLRARHWLVMPQAYIPGPPKIPHKYTGRPAIPQIYVPVPSNTKNGKTCGFRRRLWSR